ncbi:hypothetical protein KBX73_13090 [Acetobacter persici]|uniref:hypothetical protein n=1 Tax=Acetobacter persici TaxID=1076596 RepID=UPI0020CE019B|nr:hypothetical protein [Acetobacter persici]MCP9320689.1 hypothetical protein [Acetobacter persici]
MSVPALVAVTLSGRVRVACPAVEKALRPTDPEPRSCLRYGLTSPRWPFRL